MVKPTAESKRQHLKDVIQDVRMRIDYPYDVYVHRVLTGEVWSQLDNLPDPSSALKRIIDKYGQKINELCGDAEVNDLAQKLALSLIRAGIICRALEFRVCHKGHVFPKANKSTIRLQCCQGKPAILLYASSFARMDTGCFWIL